MTTTKTTTKTKTTTTSFLGCDSIELNLVFIKSSLETFASLLLNQHFALKMHFDVPVRRTSETD